MEQIANELPEIARRDAMAIWAVTEQVRINVPTTLERRFGSAVPARRAGEDATDLMPRQAEVWAH